MKIVLSNIISIINPTDEILTWARKRLTFVNPQYAKMRNMGYSVYKVPKDIKLYNINDDTLYIPMGMFEELYKLHPVKEDYKDCTCVKSANIKSNITLRDYQTPTVRAVKEHCTGILSLKVGCGKTESILHTISELGVKTLFMAHTYDLVNQAKERCESKMECHTSLITEGKLDKSGDIVFGTVQSVLKFIENGELNQDDFGMIVLDECQHLGANPNSLQIFRTVFEYFAARYKVGLSAEVHRADGLQKCILAIIGNIIYGMERDDYDNYRCMYNGKCLYTFPVDKFQVPCQVKVIATYYDVSDKLVFTPNGGTIQFASLISSLSEDKDRNELIISTLKKIEGSTIIVSDRVEQLKYLCERVGNGVQIDGSTPKKIRKKALDDVRAGKIKYLYASYSLIKEGVDCPILSNLVMATPVKDFGIVVQTCGRIMRPYEGKSIATVYDFYDYVGMLSGFYCKRRNVYRNNNWKIENPYGLREEMK